ncbi:MAG: Bax inhibitor-1 family protein [Myxococcales bacterium]|nr:Bax inhibitor-1 family protein [Myxococcales bacterium]
MNTYLHLFGAVMLFVLIEFALFQSGLFAPVLSAVAGLPWMAVLGIFMVGSWLATRAAHTATSMTAQYLALGVYVGMWSLLFVIPLAYAMMYAPGAISSAAQVTVFGFAGLTAVAFTTRKDFSFLGAILKWIAVCAMLLIGAGLIFGFELGTFFSVGMVAFAGAAILYDTSNVIHHYPEDRYVGAALQLFASVAMMFWYLLQIFSSRD